MIPKGNQRAGGQQLATHLLNAYDNDRVEVVQVRGAIAPDLHGAFAEWYAQAKATKCVKYLYSLSINPDHTQGPFKRDHYFDFIARTEARLRLAGQPRAVVFHVKHGREHCHVVWSRIDIDKMKAVQLSHDRQKLRAVAQEYARDYNLTLPSGMSNDRGKARYAFRAAAENLTEKQQQERTGISKTERREQITKAWRESSDARSFIKSLKAAGYYLARGDQRAYVVVDLYGEVHSLSRQLIGIKSKEIKARFADHPLEKLPNVADAQDDARQRRLELTRERQEQERKDKEPSSDMPAEAKRPTADERREDLRRAHTQRRAQLDSKRQQLAERHRAERKGLSDLQSARSADIARDRAAKQPQGVLALLARITGFNALTEFRQARQDRQTEQTHRQQKDALTRRHKREMENFRHHESGLTSLEKRERRSLETALRREAFRSIAAPVKARTPEPELTPAQQAKADKARQLAEQFRSAAAPRQRQPGKDAFELTPEQREKIAAFKRTAGEMSASAAGKGTAKKPQDKLSSKFNEAARVEPAPPPGSLAPKFNEKAEKPAAEKLAPASEKPADPRLREIRENAADLTAAQRRALDLAKEFRERAGPTRPAKERDTGRDKHYRHPPQDFSVRR